MKSILVWDIPTRIFHWLFAASFAAAFLTAELDGWAGVHVFAGLLMLGLFVYRVVWGFVGSRYARFASFLFSPQAAIKHLADTLKGKAARHVGHNPAGSWAIYLLLLLGLGISLSGLTMLFVGEQVEEAHEALAYAALCIVIVHVSGVIIASLSHRENLPRAMVTGRKEGEDSQGIPSACPVAAVVMLALLGAFSYTYWKGWDAQTQSVQLPFLSQPLQLGEQDKRGENHHAAEHEDDDD